MKLALAFTLLMTTFQVKAKDKGCFPESSLRYPVSYKSSGLSERNYEDYLLEGEKILGPYVLEHFNKTLILQRKWNEERVNAHATRDWDDNPVIVINGGMARHPEMNRDAFFLILCHELGHQFGGAPKKFRGNTTRRSWSSAEGQADYFATMKCLPLFFDENEKINGPAFVSPEATRICGNEAFCHRLVSASVSVANIFADIKGAPAPRLEDRDSTVVSRTNYDHPNAQCRLDTLIEGMRCEERLKLPLDPIDPRINVCVRSTHGGEIEGTRPRCWYFPQDSFR